MSLDTSKFQEGLSSTRAFMAVCVFDVFPVTAALLFPLLLGHADPLAAKARPYFFNAPANDPIGGARLCCP